MAILFILFALFGFVFLGIGGGSTSSGSGGTGRIAPVPKCSQVSGADTNTIKKHCRGANP
jgi:hypothetical protein